MTALAWFAKSVGMTDEVSQRHANAWSVYTRFVAIPAGILAGAFDISFFRNFAHA